MAADTTKQASRRQAQEMELRAAGCDSIVEEHGSGASRARPALLKLLREIGAGDTLVVVRLDRLARSVSHLLEVIEDLTAKSAHFRSLQDPIDTTTPGNVLAAGPRRGSATRARADLRTHQSRNPGGQGQGQAPG